MWYFKLLVLRANRCKNHWQFVPIALLTNSLEEIIGLEPLLSTRLLTVGLEPLLLTRFRTVNFSPVMSPCS